MVKQVNRVRLFYIFAFMDLRSIKERFGIIGDNPQLNRAIEIATKVATTDLSVLVTGESGVGKESIPQIIHQFSPRKHAMYITVNCGAIPEGTIDSELFGHEKGAFTGATEARKGYFEVADGGTIFLDEVAELPNSTQARLLRVLQTGDFIRVGSSKVQKCNVRVVAATNVNLPAAIQNGKFREDLYYRLNTVPIFMPSLRDRKEDIALLFRKFASDFSDKYKMPAIRLDDEAKVLLENYRWPGNIRQLKNVVEQMSVLEQNRIISAKTLGTYLPSDGTGYLPVVTGNENKHPGDFMSERDIFNRVLLKLQKDMDMLKQEVEMLKKRQFADIPQNKMIEQPVRHDEMENNVTVVSNVGGNGEIIGNDRIIKHIPEHITEEITPVTIIEDGHESLSIQDVNAELIRKALEKHNGKRKAAAMELGISERTLYRKLKEQK